MILFGDAESTGLNPYMSEIIEAYFELHDKGEVVSTYHFKSKVNNWSDEAAEIHGITKEEMLTYPDKKIAWDNFLLWLPDEFDFACYVNTNTALGNLWYDVVLIQMELMDHLNVNRPEHTPFNPDNKINVYDISKQSSKKSLFKPLKRLETNRDDLSLSGVYKAMYGVDFDAHNAKDDVKAMIKIYYDLLDADENKIVIRDQLSLL